MASKIVKPFLDRVVIKRVAATEKVGQIFVPQVAQSSENKGTVVAVGPGRVGDAGNVIPCNCNVGDEVLLSEFGGHKITVDETEYMIYRDSDILGVVEEGSYIV